MYIIDEHSTGLIINFEPLNEIDSFTGFTDNIVGENSTTYFTKKYRYSLDNVTFSDYHELTNESLISIIADPTATYYFKFVYTKVGNDDLVINDFSLGYVMHEVPYMKKVNQDCCELQIEQVQSYIGNDCNVKSIFDPAKLDQSYELTNQLNTWLSSQYGHCSKYYRTDPEASSKDVILKEYSLYNISEVKDINIVVPENDFPDNAPQFDPLDMDFLEIPWEVQISVREWCNTFGENTNPKRQDVIYMPITNRVYEIESAYLFKDFISKGTYWKVNLIKYQDKSNRSFDESVSDQIEQEFEEMTRSVEDAFGQERKEEIEQIVKEVQYEVIGTGEYDSTRSGLAKGLVINRENIENNYTVFSKYQYDLTSASAEYVSPFESVAVEYRATPKLQPNENLSYTAWFKYDSPVELTTKAIFEISPYSADQAKLSFNNEHGYLTGEVVEVKGINDVNGIYVLEVLSDTEILIRKSISGSYQNLTGVVTQKQLITNILHGYQNDSSTGLIVGVMKTGLVVRINTSTYIFNHSFVAGNWYSTVINIGNIFNQVSAYIYERAPEENRTGKLVNVFTETQVMARAEFELSESYKVLGGDLLLTNIRLFGQIIEPEYHSSILSQYVVKDNQLSHIVDNCVDPLRLARTKQIT